MPATTRIPVALRLPPRELDAIERYAKENQLSKTDSFLYFLRRGIESETADGDITKKLDSLQKSISALSYAVLKERVPELDIDDIRSLVQEAALNFPGIEKVYLFGSYARNEATEESDIDLRIETNMNAPFTLYDVARFQKDLESRSGRETDVVTARVIKNANLADAIEREKVLLYEREE